MVPGMPVPKDQNEAKDLGRDSIDWREPVPPEFDQAEGAGLGEGTREPPPACLFGLLAYLSFTDNSIRDTVG